MRAMKFINQLNPRGALAARMRRKRGEHVLALIAKVHAEKGSCRIIDLGGEPAYWNVFDRSLLEGLGVHVTLVNPEHQSNNDSMFDVVVGDACSLPQFADQSFDLVHSNSVIEHVGLWERMEAFAREARRLAPRYYVQTPYQWFPVEPHFVAPLIHWRSERHRAKWVLRNRPGAKGDYGNALRAVQSIWLLDKTQMRYLFSDARHLDEKFAGLTKSLLAIRDVPGSV